MNILWFTWKDLTHPLAGGAEVVNEELAKRLVEDGNEVIFIVGGYKGMKNESTKSGYRIIRLGNRLSVYWKAYRYYKKNFIGWADIVIDEVNTIPFFCKLYVKEPNIIFAHMLCRVIWFFELPEPLSSIGYFIEPFYLKLLNKSRAITVSESTKKDLMSVGFKANNISIISEGVNGPILNKLPPLNKKIEEPIILSLGSMRPMKQTIDQIKAFELAKIKIPNLKLLIAGDSSGKYGAKVLDTVKKSPFSNDIVYKGKVSQAEKYRLMRQCSCILVTSIKEGWGLIVTEANSQGTPGIVYDVDGLRDSVRNNKTGLITKQNNSQHLANSVVKLLTNQKRYNSITTSAWLWSKHITFDKSFHEFNQIINSKYKER
jgi:glycosyltransferase involved in cell wall biosynthesis